MRVTHELLNYFICQHSELIDAKPSSRQRNKKMEYQRHYDFVITHVDFTHIEQKMAKNSFFEMKV